MRATYKEMAPKYHDNKKFDKQINFIDSQNSQNRK